MKFKFCIREPMFLWRIFLELLINAHLHSIWIIKIEQQFRRKKCIKFILPLYQLHMQANWRCFIFSIDFLRFLCTDEVPLSIQKEVPKKNSRQRLALSFFLFSSSPTSIHDPFQWIWRVSLYSRVSYLM